MRKIALLLALFAPVVGLFSQSVSNLAVSFTLCGEACVKFNLTSSIPVNLGLVYSLNGGTTWQPCVSVSGNIANQTTGNKQIYWNCNNDNVFYGIGNAIFRVIFPMQMVKVPNGTATLNNTQVTISDFFIGKYEVTQKEWQDVMGSLPSSISTTYGMGDNYPVYYVSWYDAIAFCNKLSLQEGRTPVYTVSGVDFSTLTYAQIPPNNNSTWNAATINYAANGYRLPTEAEWQYAAMGGQQTHGYTYSGSDNIDDVAWYSNNSGGTSHVVGTKAPNELGIHDMSGNEWEWCNDWYGGTFPSGTSDPTGPATGSARVIRGGYWSNYASFCTVAYRSYISNPYIRYYYVGFRVVLVP